MFSRFMTRWKFANAARIHASANEDRNEITVIVFEQGDILDKTGFQSCEITGRITDRTGHEILDQNISEFGNGNKGTRMLALRANGVNQIEPAFFKWRDQEWNVFGAVLQIGIHGHHDIARAIPEPRFKSAGLAGAPGILDRLQPRVHSNKLVQQIQTAVGRMVIARKMLPFSVRGLRPPRLHGLLDALDKFRNIGGLIVNGGDY